LERGVVRALEHGVAVEYVLARIRKNGLRPAGLPPRLEIWPWRYRFRLFGSLDVVAGDEGLPSGKGPFVLRGMPRRLLEALLVFGGRGVRDVQIIDALWPDADGDAGRRVFDTTLHRLRRQLGDADLLRMNDGRLSLDERSCWLDTWAFDDLAAEAERQIASEGPASCLADLALRIGEIYRGQVLADDVAGSPWAARSRAQYASRFLHLAQSLGRALEHAGKATEAAALYSRSSDHRASPAP
jgi:DNA-binding SARP family transcriptional activator